MSVPAYIMKARNSAATIAMNATSDYNHFSNQAYGVINVHNREYLEQDPQRPVTAFNTVASFEIDKNHDYTQLSSLKIVTGPATFNGGAAQTVQQFVDGVGYRMLEDVKVSLTNNRLNSVTMPYLWYRIKDLMYYRDETRFKKRENYLADQASAALIAALGAGHTFLLDLDCGYLHESNETMLMISALAARIKYEIRLASHENIVNVGAAAAIATLPITECKLLQDCIHINPSEREAELERYDSDSGLFTLIHKFEVQEEALTSQLGGTITIPITLTGTYECLFIILRPYSLNDGTSTIKDPMFWSGPTQTTTAGTINWPDSFDIVTTNGAQVFAKQSVLFNRTQYRKKFFDHAYGGDWTLVANFSDDPLAENAVMGMYDFNVHGSRTLRLFYPGATGTATASSTGTERVQVTILAKGYDYRQQQHGTASVVFG